MTKLLNNPYGTSSFEEFIQQDKAFVDKTMFIKTLDQLSTNYPIILRPRRFGKSTFISMLKYFYDRSLYNQYDQVFFKTQIYKENLESHNSYHVIVFDFSGIEGNNRDQLSKHLSSSIINNSILDFKNRYPTFSFFIDEQDKNDPLLVLDNFFNCYREWLVKHPEEILQDPFGRPSIKKLYIIIDEYDNFANEILNTDREFFKRLTSQAGLLKTFYSKIKSATSHIVAKTFITGVSSVSLDSLTSGFNIAKNISTLSSFNEYAGMTEDELRNIIKELVDYESYNIDLDYMLDAMRQTYNGYAFSKKANKKLFNTSMCLRYIDEIREEETFVDPNRIFDAACNYDPTKLYDLIKFTEPKDLNMIIQTYYEGQVFEIENISESININQISQYDYTTVISILFYMGYLTIKPENEQEEPSENLLLVCPNKYMRKIFRKCFVEYFFYQQDDFLKTFTFDITSIKNNQDDLTIFIKSCEDYLGGRLTNQHLFRMTESELVAILKTKLESVKEIIFKDEFAIQVPGVGEKFIDLYIENKSQKSIYILEFKYISKSAFEKNSKLIEQKKKEAEQQLKIYKQATIFKNKEVKAYSLIFMDCKCVHNEKI